MHDNRILRINGETESLLRLALQTAFEQSESKCRAWEITKKGFILHWCEKRGTPFPGKDGLTANEVFPFVISWLNAVKPEDVELEDYEKEIDTDGENDVGWCVYCDAWGHINDVDVICAVKPVYLWIGK